MQGGCPGGGGADYGVSGGLSTAVTAATTTGGGSGSGGVGLFEIKTAFCTREGEYRLLALCEYGRPNRQTGSAAAAVAVASGGYSNSPQTNTPVKVSFIEDKICYNVGRELYIYPYKGVHKAADLSKPVDKKVYKGSFPTCHDFNQTPLQTPAPPPLLLPHAAATSSGSPSPSASASSSATTTTTAAGARAVTPVIHQASPSASSSDAPTAANGSAVTTEPASGRRTEDAAIVGSQSGTACSRPPPGVEHQQTISTTPTSDDDVGDCNTTTVTSGAGCASGLFSASGDQSPPTPPEHRCQQGLQLLVGFSAGQIQIIDPVTKDHLKSKLFNDERLIDKTKVTCLAWIPFSTQLFLVSHMSGHLYLYKSDCPSGPQAPHYQLFKSGPGFSVYTCRSKQTRNPLFRWVIGDGSLNAFAFSPGEGKFLATVSQDGVMRCFEYSRMELVGHFRSYFGGLLCVAWSPDSKYVLCGGEDDLVTLWSLAEKRVVARGQGHNSWVNCVRFDPYLCGDGGYRFGSVGQDTQLCLWDVNEADMLKPSKPKKHSSLTTNLQHVPNGTVMSQQQLNNKYSGTFNNNTAATVAISGALSSGTQQHHSSNNHTGNTVTKDAKDSSNSVSNKDGYSSHHHHHHKDKEHCNGGSSTGAALAASPLTLGSAQCPRLDQVPILEPLICKRIAAERLTALHFRQDCIVTACQEGFVCTWARPGVRSISEGGMGVSTCDRGDFGMAVAAAFIDGDVPSLPIPNNIMPQMPNATIATAAAAVGEATSGGSDPHMYHYRHHHHHHHHHHVHYQQQKQLHHHHGRAPASASHSIASGPSTGEPILSRAANPSSTLSSISVTSGKQQEQQQQAAEDSVTQIVAT